MQPTPTAILKPRRWWPAERNVTDQNLEAVWVKILRALRTDKHFALFGLLSSMNDVEFADGKIYLHTHNDAEKNMLKQHLTDLQTLAGEEATLVLQDDTVSVHDDNRDYVARLKDLFGDKVEIV